MNVLKIQQEILKDLHDKNVKGKLVSFQGVGAGLEDNTVSLLFQHKIHIIHKNEFYLDCVKLKKFENTSNLLLVSSGSKPAENKGNIKKLDKKITGVYIENDNEKVLVDEKLLKYFDDDCTFLITGKKNPVHIFENGELVGLVLPLVEPE